uniref:Uncharacterized protein n=1 Tax=Pan troglodytes TaxID=9598 RepID=G2HGW6_PANTR|nr:hypothetical protein [Pan troglodytes]
MQIIKGKNIYKASYEVFKSWKYQIITSMFKCLHI